MLALLGGASSDGRNLTFVWSRARSKGAMALPDAQAGYGVRAKALVAAQKELTLFQRRAQGARTLQVPTWRLSSLLNTLGVHGPLPVLKIDCELCEYEVLPELRASGVLNRTERIIGELHPPRATAVQQQQRRQLSRDFCRFRGNNPRLLTTQPPTVPQSDMVCI